MIINVEKLYINGVDCKTYKVIYNNNKITFVPLNSENTDYQAIQKWIAEGGVVIDNPPTQENN